MPTNQNSINLADDILIVDDESANLQLLSELLGREGYQVRPANNPQLAINSALAQPPKLILLDVRMPEIDGFEVCRRLKQDQRTRDIPIIFVSALQDMQDRVQGFEAGGVDFITKPYQEPEVLARVRTHLTLRNMQVYLEDLVTKRTAELSKSEAKYRGLVDNANVGVFQSTLHGRFIFVNDAMARMFDFDSPEYMISQGSIKRWKDPKNRERMLCELQKHGSVSNFEAEALTHTDRYIHVLFSAKLLDDNMFGMVMDVTERKQAEQKILDYQQQLKALASQLTIAEESERRRIAADLHDQVGQSLALARMQIASVRKRATDHRQMVALDAISDSLRQTVKETRSLIYDLSPPQLNEIGLSAAISEWLEEHIENRYEIKAECIVNGPEKQLDKILRSFLFRNIRELVTNVIKHSKAAKVEIKVSQDKDHVKITIKDDGIGFDANAISQSLNSKGGFGLFSIRERMSDMGGSLEIISKPGQGAEAVLCVPITLDDAQKRTSS